MQFLADRYLNGRRISIAKSGFPIKLGVRPIRIRPMDGGLFTDPTSELLKLNQSPAMRDVFFFKNELRKSYGGTQLGADFGEAVMWTGTWRNFDGVIIPVAITTRRLFYYSDLSAAWVEVSPANILTGTENHSVKVAIFNGVLYFVTLDYELRSWKGYQDSHAAVVGGFAAKALETINNRIILGHIIEGGSARAQTIRWTQNGIVKFTGPGSGSRDIADRPDHILTIKKLGPFRGVIYKEESMVDMRSTGDASFPFDTTELAQIGLLLPNSVAEWAGGHFFVSNDENIYLFNGANLPESIGDDIRHEFFSSLNYSSLDRAVGYFDRRDREYIIIIPTGSATNTVASLYYAYSPQKKRWRSGIYSGVTSIGDYKTVVGISWDEDTGTWDAATDTWNDETSTGSRMRLLMSASTKRVFILDDTTQAFDTNALQFSWQTGDIIAEEDGGEVTLLEAIIGYVVDGTASLIVDASTDLGGTFSGGATVTLGGSSLTTGDYDYIHVPFNSVLAS